MYCANKRCRLECTRPAAVATCCRSRWCYSVAVGFISRKPGASNGTMSSPNFPVARFHRDRDIDSELGLSTTDGPNSTYSICCGFVVQQVVQQIHNKSTTNRISGVWTSAFRVKICSENWAASSTNAPAAIPARDRASILHS
jgi:hypothetical protein